MKATDNLMKVSYDNYKVIVDDIINFMKVIWINTNQKAWDFLTKAMKVIGFKYENLGLHYLWDNDTITIGEYGMWKIALPYIYKYYPILLAQTSELANDTSIPVYDSITETYTHDGSSFTMTEDQPLDATEKITTPYIKNKGIAGYTANKQISHDTVAEAEKRQQMVENAANMYTFADGLCRQLIYEYNIAY